MKRNIPKKRIKSQGKSITIHSNSLLGWHLLAPDKKLGYGDKRKVTVGKCLEMIEKDLNPSCCKRGMHASHEIWRTMKSFNEPMIMCRVLVQDQVTNQNKTYLECFREKFCGRYRTVLWMKKMPKEIWALCWALDCMVGVKQSTRKKLKDWARANGCPFVDYDTYGNRKAKS